MWDTQRSASLSHGRYRIAFSDVPRQQVMQAEALTANPNFGSAHAAVPFML